MKKRVYLLAILCLLMVVSSRQKVNAACDNVSGFGAVTIQVPKLPSTGIYNVWTRMQAPDATHNQYNLEINGQNCLVIGGSSLTPNQWTWVSFQDGDLSTKVQFDFNNISGNTAKLIGFEHGVKIDKLLFVKTDCVPINDGTNCQSNDNSVDTQANLGAIQVPPPSNGPLSGLIIPSQTVSQNEGSISKVKYSVDGKEIPSTKNIQLDTTLLSNGTHQVAMEIFKTNGEVINEATTLFILNPENAFTPVERWARLNQSSAIIIGTIISIGLIVIAAILVIRKISLKKRLLEFKGF